MRVILASDPKASKAAAAMSVNVGSLSNPEEWPGLAHFCEHMLFLGTERFAEGEFEQYIASQSGTNNAYTDAEDTVYFFDVAASSLPGALDRFSDFFIAPLFTESATGREVAAIESEHQKNLQTDSRRIDMLLRATRAQREHPYSYFATGNRRTLRGGDDNARRALLAFYSEYYRAPQMALSLTGPQSLDELQRLTVSRFESVGGGPSSPLASRKYDALPPPLVPGCTTALQVVPVRDVRSLTLTWCVPYAEQYELADWVKCKPDALLVGLLSSRAAGAPLAYLKQAGLANAVEARVDELTRSFIVISAYVGLTEAGLARWEEAAGALFSYLRALREDGGVPDHIYAEAHANSQLAFDYAEPSRPRAFVTASAPQLSLYDPNEWLTGPAIFAPGAEAPLRVLLGALRPSSLAATVLVGRAFESRANQIEPIYSTRYTETSIAPQLGRWEAAPRIAALHAPRPNPFIPTALAIKASPSARPPTSRAGHIAPTLLQDEAALRVFFLQDVSFRRPKAYAFFALRSPELYKTPAASAAAEVYQLMLDDALQDVAFQAAQAGLSVSSAVSWRGFDLSLGGYDEHLPELTSLVSSTLRNVPLEKGAFERQKDKLQRLLGNLDQRQPSKLATYRRCLALESPRFSNEQLATATKQLTLAELERFQSSLLREMEIEVFIGGNVRADEADRIVCQLQQALPAQPLPVAQRPVRRIRRLPRGATLQQFVASSSSESNSAVEVFYQIGTDEGDNWVLLSLLAQLMNKPFYASLRTRQQLGYIVQCTQNELFGVRGLTFTVQSATASPVDVELRIHEFVRGFRSTLLAATDENVAGIGEGLAAQFLDVDARLDTQATRLWAECSNQRYDFDRPWTSAAAARRVTRQALLSFFDEYVAEGGPQMRRLTTHIFSQRAAPKVGKLVQPALADEFYEQRQDRIGEREIIRRPTTAVVTRAVDEPSAQVVAADVGRDRRGSAAALRRPAPAAGKRVGPLVMRALPTSLPGHVSR